MSISVEKGEGDGGGSKGFIDYVESYSSDELKYFCSANAVALNEAINSPIDVYGNTVLHYAVSCNDFALVCVLLMRGANPNVKNKAEVNSIRIARRLDFPIISAILQRFAGEKSAEEQVLQQEDCTLQSSLDAAKAFSNVENLSGTDLSNPGSEKGSASGSFSPSRFSPGSTPVAISPFAERLVLSAGNQTALADSAIVGATASKSNGFGILPKAMERRLLENFSSRSIPPSKPTDEEVLLTCELYKDHQPSFLDAFYLHIVDDVYPEWRQLPKSMLEKADALGQTALMKASVQGYLGLVRDLCSLNINVDQTDNFGRTALFWAVIGGQTDVVSFLLGSKRANPDGLPFTNAEGKAVVLYTPVAAAVFRRDHPSGILRLLLKHGAKVNQTFGLKDNKTALMLAVWLQEESIVKLLLNSTSERLSDSVQNTERWLRQGLIHKKRLEQDSNVWQSDMGAHSARAPNENANSNTLGIKINYRLSSLKDRVMNFNAFENNYIKTTSALIESYRTSGGLSLKKLNDNGELLDSHQNCKPSSPESEVDLLQCSLNTTGRQRQRSSVSGSRGRDFRQGLNLDKIFGNRMDLIKEIAEKVPSKGTSLTVLYLQVYQCLVYLVIAANKNIKHRYVAIAAKANFYAMELVQQAELLEEKDREVLLARVNKSSTSGNAESAPSVSLFSQTVVKQRIKRLAQILQLDYYKKLMLATRIAIGVWPPANAISDMLAAASSIARTCRDLATLANLTGYWPIIPIKFEFQMALSEHSSNSDELGKVEDLESSFGAEVPGKVNSPYFGGISEGTASESTVESRQNVFIKMLTLGYAEYKRQNDFKQLELLSKSMESESEGPSAPSTMQIKSEQYTSVEKQQKPDFSSSGSATDKVAASIDGQEEIEPAFAPLVGNLEALLKVFVLSVQEVKRMNDRYTLSNRQPLDAEQKGLLLELVAKVISSAESVVGDIESNYLFEDIPDTATLNRNDIEILKNDVTIALGSVLIKPLIRSLIDDVKMTAKQLQLKGKLATGAWPPADAMHQLMLATIPSVTAVKKLVTVSKVAGKRLARLASIDVKRKEKQRKDVLHNEKVKNLFKLWEEQQGHQQKEETPKDGNAQVLSPVTSMQRYSSLGSNGAGNQSFGTDLRAGTLAGTGVSDTYGETAVPAELEWLDDASTGILITDNKIKGATLQRLIEYVTSPFVSHSIQEILSYEILLTHHSFTTSLELLDCLAKRYLCPPPAGLEQAAFEQFRAQKQQSVRLNVCNLVSKWITWFFEDDILDNEPLAFRVKEFLDKWVRAEFPQQATQLLQLLSDKFLSPRSVASSAGVLGSHQALANSKKADFILGKYPKSILPKQFVNPNTPELLAFLMKSPRNVLEVDPLEFARQLTLIEMEDFQKVKPHECLDQIWLERKQKELAIRGGLLANGANSVHSNIQRMIRHTNGISMWIANNILEEPEIKNRMQVLRYFCQVAVYCRELNNFNGITTIVGGLSIAPVKRLSNTWNLMMKKFPKIWEQYQEASDCISPKSQYAMYRKVLKSVTPPAIPFLGVYLTDLTFIELGNQDYLNDKQMINMDKRSKVVSIIKQLQYFQTNSVYTFHPVTGIQELINQLSNPSKHSSFLSDASLLQKTEDQLYEQSLLVEPKAESDISSDSE